MDEEKSRERLRSTSESGNFVPKRGKLGVINVVNADHVDTDPADFMVEDLRVRP